MVASPIIRLLSRSAVLVIAAAPTAGLNAQSSARNSLVIASVADASSGAPLENADVRLVDARMGARTDWSGEARIPNVPPGKYKFEVRHPGYAVLDVDLLVEGDSTGPVFRLASTGPVPSLQPVTVNAQQPPSPLSDFETRRAQGIGKFLTADQLAAESSRSLMSIVVQAFNGLMSAPDPEQTSRIILMTRRQDARLDLHNLPQDKRYLYESHCGVDVYLDGSQFKDDLDSIKPADLAAVEYYPMSSAPGQYRRLSESCGVLLLWSKK
jgi:carboxypeptidase family protein